MLNKIAVEVNEMVIWGGVRGSLEFKITLLREASPYPGIFKGAHRRDLGVGDRFGGPAHCYSQCQSYINEKAAAPSPYDPVWLSRHFKKHAGRATITEMPKLSNSA